MGVIWVEPFLILLERTPSPPPPLSIQKIFLRPLPCGCRWCRNGLCRLLYFLGQFFLRLCFEQFMDNLLLLSTFFSSIARIISCLFCQADHHWSTAAEGYRARKAACPYTVNFLPLLMENPIPIVLTTLSARYYIEIGSFSKIIQRATSLLWF